MRKIILRHPLVMIILLVASFVSMQNAKAQSAAINDLYTRLEKKDSLLFNAAFNTCNIKEIETILDESFVFYQDQGYGGHTTNQPYTEFIESIQKNFCNNKTVKMRRELVKGSLEVFSTDNKNAVQTGTQRFYVIAQGQDDKMVEESKFSRDWQKKDGDWKMTKELDYMVNTKFSNVSTSSLYKEIAHMDSVLFDAFNAHDVDKLKTLFTDDLEFYHDKGGLSTYQQNMEAFKSNFTRNNGLRRDLVAGSLEVYPIKDYGAVEIGAHRFCHVENGKDDCGTFKFMHVWQKKNGEWKISRVVSYDH